METLVLENEYKIVVLIFGAAYAAPNICCTKYRHNNFILVKFSTVRSPTENSRIQGLFTSF